MVISDNGASAESGPNGMVNEPLFFNNVEGSMEENLAALDKLGGPKYCNHYAWRWTWACNTPFRRWKRDMHSAPVKYREVAFFRSGFGRREAAQRMMARGRVLRMVLGR